MITVRWSDPPANSRSGRVTVFWNWQFARDPARLAALVSQFVVNACTFQSVRLT
jgi:hypothetical protein